MPLVSEFSYANFASTTGLNLVGDAAVVSSKLRLTPAVGGKVGTCWRTSRVFVAHGFRTDFSFQISGGGGVANPGHQPHGVGGDGITFCLQDASNTEIHGGGQNIGYAGMINALVFEFDTYDDFTFGDIGDNELAIHSSTGSVSSNYATSGRAQINIAGSPGMKDGAIHTATIIYDRFAGDFKVYLDNVLHLTLSAALNTLVSRPDGELFVGFTSSTGGAYESHDILSWSFSAFRADAQHAHYHNGEWHIIPSQTI